MFDFAPTQMPAPGPRAALSVSGGGMLGVIPAAMLARYEKLGKAAYGSDYRLCQSFDLVGGTSTGAVIATAIALGCEAREIADFYLKDAPKVMQRRWSAVPFLHDIYKGDEMEAHFSAATNGARLEASDLRCDLAITVKNMTRAEPILFTTLSDGPHEVLGARVRNDALPLDRLLRASTAAPFLFSPVRLTLDCGEEVSAVDGGMSPFNNPALLVAQLAARAYGGPCQLTALSTGAGRPRFGSARAGQPAVLRALKALLTNLKDAEIMTHELLTSMAATGQLGYRHHDLALDRETLAELGFDVSKKEMSAIRRFGDAAGKELLFEAARAKAEATIHAPLPLVKAFAPAMAV